MKAPLSIQVSRGNVVTLDLVLELKEYAHDHPDK